MGGYALGESVEEHKRLEQQAEAMGEMTGLVLAKAGIAPGMRVLDIGCGVGDVSMIAAALVGPGGAVLGVDRDASALERARGRAASRGIANVTFLESDLGAGLPEGPFDAVVGRLVLMYAPDPGALLGRLKGVLAPGGLLAFQEIDISAAKVVPPVPLASFVMDRLQETFRRAGANPTMGLALDGAFRSAGLVPQMFGGTAMDARGDGFGPAWVAQTVRSLLPRMEALGVATAAEMEVDTLEQRLRHAFREAGALNVWPMMVGAWARLPA